MDTSKDKNQEQENKISTEVNTQKSSKSLDFTVFFKNDSDFVFVYKKTEKLSTALYMVTNLFSDNEPIKWSIRKKVSELLSFILTYKDINSSEKEAFLHLAKIRILEIVSFLEITTRSGLVSEMNFSVLKQEFLNLISALEESRSEAKKPDNYALSTGFFHVAKEHSLGAGSKLSLHEDGAYFSGQKNQSTRNIHETFGIKNRESSDVDSGVLKRSNRQNVIINLLKKKGELTIKDISQVIKDCSEKTIQRELIAFIENGVVKRTGERRWSKYSLI